MIKNYRKFKDELILEKALKESVLYLSPEISKHLSEVGGDIAKDIIDQAGKDIKPDATFLDMGEKEGEVTFVTMKNAVKKLAAIYYGDPEFVKRVESPESQDPLWPSILSRMLSASNPEFWNASRNPIKLGRLVRQIFPGKYTDSQIEDFVNRFKGAVGSESDLFELASGDAIAEWYDSKNYKEEKGQLGGSCMAKKSKEIFSIYTQNPEVCRLLILKDKENPEKIIGRALVWKVDKKLKDGSEFFMDRQYTIEDSDVERFRKFAKKNGWAYKTHNNHYTPSKVTIGDESTSAFIEVGLKPTEEGGYEYESYPYMDTFKRYDPSTGILYNDSERDDDNIGQYILEQTDGRYEVIEDEVWSDYLDRTILRDDAVWSDAYGDYLDINSAARVTRGSSQGWYPDDSDDIVYTEHSVSGYEPLHVDDCEWSQYESDYLFADDAKTAICDMKDDGTETGSIECDWVYKNNEDFAKIPKDSDWKAIVGETYDGVREASLIKKNLCVTDKYDKIIPKIYETKTYVAVSPKENSIAKGIEGAMLTKRDAKMLGWKVNKEETFTVDRFAYHRELNEAYGEFESSLLDFMVDSLSAEIEKGGDSAEAYKQRLDEIWNCMPPSYDGYRKK